MRWLRVVLVVLLALFAGACAARPSLSFTEADADAIRGTTTEALKIATSATPDWEAYAALYYADDASVYLQGSPTVHGKPAIAAFLKAFPAVQDWKAEILSVEGSELYAHVVGIAHMTMKPVAPDTVGAAEDYRYIEVWKRQPDGKWRVIHDIANLDVKPAPAPPTP